MAKSELRKELEAIVEKMKKQHQLFEGKVDGLDPVAAAKSPKLYEKFMPVIDQFQEDLTYISSETYQIVQSINDKLANMFDSIEAELEKLDDSEIEEESTEELEESGLELEGSNVETELNFGDDGE